MKHFSTLPVALQYFKGKLSTFQVHCTNLNEHFSVGKSIDTAGERTSRLLPCQALLGGEKGRQQWVETGPLGIAASQSLLGGEGRGKGEASVSGDRAKRHSCQAAISGRGGEGKRGGTCGLRLGL